jgi:cell division protein FtsZ
VIDDSLGDEVRVTVIATGFGGGGSRRRRRRESVPAEAPIGEAPTPRPAEGGFEIADDVLEVPSFLRDS